MTMTMTKTHAEDDLRASPHWYVRHDRDGAIRDTVWYVGPYPSREDAEAAASDEILRRPIRPGPNGPIDSVEVVRARLMPHARRYPVGAA
jgi:hypothetical protein